VPRWTKTAAAPAGVNTESARQADLSARMEALKALQEKVKTDGKLRPWLAKHGLDGLQGLWSRIHIEPGWENALEAALRERLGALEVGPPGHGARLLGAATRRRPSWPSTAPARRRAADAAGGLPRLADLLRLHDAGLRAVLADWLQGCYTADSWTTRWPARASCSRAK
jgi:chromosome segregation protein